MTAEQIIGLIGLALAFSFVWITARFAVTMVKAWQAASSLERFLKQMDNQK